MALLHSIDVLVDGRFVQEQKSLSLLYRGSSNQRLIDVPKTLATGEITLWTPPCGDCSANFTNNSQNHKRKLGNNS